MQIIFSSQQRIHNGSYTTSRQERLKKVTTWIAYQSADVLSVFTAQAPEDGCWYFYHIYFFIYITGGRCFNQHKARKAKVQPPAPNACCVLLVLSTNKSPISWNSTQQRCYILCCQQKLSLHLCTKFCYTWGCFDKVG